MPTLNQNFPAPGGVNNPVVTGLLLVCGVTIVIALVLTIVGLARAARLSSSAARQAASV
jgi:hypothetical protein